MAANSTPAGATDRRGPLDDLARVVENSRTARAIRLAAVFGTLAVIGLLTLYLVAGAAGLLSEDQGTTWDTARSIARILFWPVLGSFVFLFLRPWVEDSLQSWLGDWREQNWYRPVTLVLVLVLGTFLGYQLAEKVMAVSYTRLAAVEAGIDEAASTAAGLALTKLQDSGSSEADDDVGQGGSTDPDNNSGVDEPPATAGPQPDPDDADATEMADAVRAAVRTAIAATIRSRPRLPEDEKTEKSAADDQAPPASPAAQAAAYAAARAALDHGLEPSQFVDLRDEIAQQITPAVSAAISAADGFASVQTLPRERAEDWLSLCLMFVAFGPRELTNLMRQKSPAGQNIFGSAPAGLSLYLGVLFGLIWLLRG